MDFSNYRFRASQTYKLMTGTIGLTDIQKEELVGYVSRKTSASMGEKDENGKAIKPLTARQEILMQELSQKNKDKELPKTMQTELRKIFRSEKYKRNFIFTNKYIQKGLQEEEAAISLYQKYRELKGHKGLLIKNKERFFGEYLEGEPDLFDHPIPEKRKEGFDTKCSWDLDTFPFIEDGLDDQYECQNQTYMHITGLKKWTTVYCLVNASEDAVHKEKQKHYFALKHKGTFPDEEGSKYYDEYIKKCHEIERKMIFDYELFVETNPYHQLTIGKDEWFGEGYDIPIEERVLEFVSIYKPEMINELISRVKIGRDYLKKLASSR